MNARLFFFGANTLDSEFQFFFETWRVAEILQKTD